MLKSHSEYMGQKALREIEYFLGITVNAGTTLEYLMARLIEERRWKNDELTRNYVKGAINAARDREKEIGHASPMSPREEWEKAKKLIATLYDSGVVKLLWQLCEYINSDPILSEPVRGYRPILSNKVFLKDNKKAFSIAGSDESAKYFIVYPTDNPFLPMPWAGSILFYNFVEIRERNGQLIRHNKLRAFCSEEGSVNLDRGYGFDYDDWLYSPKSETMTIANASKSTEAVFEALGKLYDERPALPYNLIIKSGLGDRAPRKSSDIIGSGGEFPFDARKKQEERRANKEAFYYVKERFQSALQPLVESYRRDPSTSDEINRTVPQGELIYSPSIQYRRIEGFEKQRKLSKIEEDYFTSTELLSRFSPYLLALVSADSRRTSVLNPKSWTQKCCFLVNKLRDTLLCQPLALKLHWSQVSQG